MNFLRTLATDWATRCFGVDHVNNHRIVALRAFEEMVELCQNLEVDPDKLHATIGIVYARPRGDFDQEMGGVVMALEILLSSVGSDRSLQSYGEDDIRRVLQKTPMYFSERNKAKLKLGLDHD